MKEKDRIRRMNLKQTVLTHYGGGVLACVDCGFNDIRALSIDHIHNDGGAHRKSGVLRIYKWLIDNDFPSGYQTLCMNCQWIKKYRNQKILLPAKYRNNLTRRIRHWVSLREQGFIIYDVMIGLGLEKEKRGKVRVALFRICKEGKIQRRTFKDGTIMPGTFSLPSKVIKVKVFG